MQKSPRFWHVILIIYEMAAEQGGPPDPSHNVLGNCARCGSGDKLKFCSRCQVVRYCGPVCQKADWQSHHARCRTPPSIQERIMPHETPREVAPGVLASVEVVPEKARGEVASLIRVFLNRGGQRQATAAKRLAHIAFASVADALTIVSAEGLLRCVARPLVSESQMVPLSNAADAADAADAAFDSIRILAGAVIGANASVCTRIAQEGELLRALLRILAKGSKPYVASILENLSVPAASACALAVGALSDDDLRALVEAASGDDTKNTSVLALFCNCCRVPTAPIGRLITLGLPLALAELLACDVSERTLNAGCCIECFLEAPHDQAWTKAIVKPLRAAYRLGLENGALAEARPSVMNVVNLLTSMALAPDTRVAVAKGLPDFVATLRGRGAVAAAAAATIICNLSPHPGTRAASLREGAVPALAALLHAGSLFSAPAVAAFVALGSMCLFDDVRPAILATDAPARLMALLRGLPAIGPASMNVQFVISVSNFALSNVLPAATLADTRVLAYAARLCGGADAEVARLSARLLLILLAMVDEEACDVTPFVDAVAAAHRELGRSGAYDDVLVEIIPMFVGRSSEAIRKALGEILVGDAPFIARQRGAIGNGNSILDFLNR